jgi:LuxR family maltose regulon positive regulatory protein
METPLLQTKLHIPPTRLELVSRPRLIERLNEGLHRKLTLVSAPAFLRYFIAVLQQLDPNLGQTVQGMLQSPQPSPIETLMAVLINEISAFFTDARCVVILDDYHLIEAKPIDDALAFLLDHLPPPPGGMHLVIATRDDPHLPLARLRAQDQLTELRAADLRFTSAETAEFLNQLMGLNLSTEDIAALETRTEGWVVGLQLAALALQGTISMQGHDDASSLIKSFTGSHRFVLDYLIEEVLNQQPEDIQTFLLQTAILDRLTGSLCDAITGQDNGQQTLEMLEHANLFIVPLDTERHWYRYHHLFADLLRQRLRQTHPEKLTFLHTRAGEWFTHQGLSREAIKHSLAARCRTPIHRFANNPKVLLGEPLHIAILESFSSFSPYLVVGTNL